MSVEKYVETVEYYLTEMLATLFRKIQKENRNSRQVS